MRLKKEGGCKKAMSKKWKTEKKRKGVQENGRSRKWRPKEKWRP